MSIQEKITKRKVVFITYRNIAEINSGDKLYSYSLLLDLIDEYDVLLINITENDYNESDLIRLKSKCKGNCSFFKEKKCNSLIASVKSIFTLDLFMHVNKRFRKRNRKNIVEEVKKNNPEVIIWDHLRSLAYFDDSFLNYNNVLIQHNNEECLYFNRIKSFNVFKNVFLFIQYLYVKKINRFIYANFNKVLFISSYDIERVKINPKNFLIKYLNLRFEHSYYEVDKIKKYDLLFVGSLDWDPNVEAIKWFISEVFPLLPSDTTMAIVGRNPSKNIYKLVNDKISIYANVLSVENFYLNSKIFISPILTGAGINIKIFEALSYGIPIVGTKHSFRGFPINEKLKWCTNPEEFVCEIVKLLNQKVYYNSLYENQLSYYEDYVNKSKGQLSNILK